MSNIKELIRDEIRKWQSNIEAKCPESTRSRNYTKEEWNAIYEYNAYTRILSFIDTLPDEPITSCNELAEAAMNYIAPIENEDGLNVINFSGRDIKDAFIAGAEWQKRKMMEGAEEGEVQEVYRDDDGIHCCVSVGTDYNPGTIVYVITIPKEGEQ